MTNLHGGVVDVIREGLHHVRAPPGVGDLGDARLLLDDDLGVPGDASALHRGQTQSFVERVGVERLRPPEHGRHGFDHRAHHVVVRILKRERKTYLQLWASSVGGVKGTA